jgi:dihydroneopterin aldolase
MRQKIQLTGLRVFAHHGVFDFEKQNGQEFVIDAAVWVDASNAVANDDVASTVHYGELADAIAANVANEPVDLIETLAWRLLKLVLAFGSKTDATRSDALVSPVIKAEITVHKPNAPINHPFADVSVTVKGGRK